MAETQREAFMAELEAMEEWLYTEEGFDSAKSVFVEKLASLSKVGDPVFARKKESEDRSDYATRLNKTIESYRTKINSDACAHLDEADQQAVRNACKNAADWINGRLEAQASKQLFEDLEVTCADISTRERQLHNECRSIVNKPKPKPKPKPKAEPKGENADSKAPSGNEDAKTGDGDKHVDSKAGMETKASEEGEAAPPAAPEAMDTTE
jgi:heat shock protein 4